jgi:hypothetical protein
LFYEKIITFILPIFLLSSCSVVMAAKKSQGVKPHELHCASTRGQILATGARIIASEYNNDGNLVESYCAPKGSDFDALRALGHGVLDVATGFAWELVGTPFEACTDNGHVYFTVVYDANQYIIGMSPV